ncbi:hypothetical protein [Anaeromyxobacter sp. K]|uniref:hypothetical protein n=1 Tax=Anaeromyxobacter sp. (strain K) TaxID=447217 RepID=UPI000674194E|nr:hypothetical protein [Anaeromyxobacter sp. K]
MAPGNQVARLSALTATRSAAVAPRSFPAATPGGLAAHALAPVLARPAAWRVLDLATGLTMCAFAVRLALGAR